MAVVGEPPIIAPLWKRSLAGVIDSLPFLALAVAAPGNDAKARRAGRGRGLVAIALSGAYHITLTVKQGQTLGQRMLGVRVVDAKTAQLPSAVQSTVRWAVTIVPDTFATLMPRSQRLEVTLAAIEELQPEIDRLRQRYGDERETLSRELTRLYEGSDVNLLGACLPLCSGHLRAWP